MLIHRNDQQAKILYSTIRRSRIMLCREEATVYYNCDVRCIQSPVYSFYCSVYQIPKVRCIGVLITRRWYGVFYCRSEATVYYNCEVRCIQSSVY